MSEWQPIESAPQDGSDFLAYYPLGKYVENLDDELDLGHTEPVIATVWINDDGHLEGNTYFMTPDGHPTHWMPLPEPPAL